MTVPAGHLPSRRRLHAGGERAAGEPVSPRAQLLDRLAVEVDVGILAGEVGQVDARCRCAMLPDAFLKVPVPLATLNSTSLGGDAAVGVREHHVAPRHEPVRVQVVVHLVGEELERGAGDRQLDVADEAPLVGRDLLEPVRDLVGQRASAGRVGLGRPALAAAGAAGWCAAAPAPSAGAALHRHTRHARQQRAAFELADTGAVATRSWGVSGRIARGIRRSRTGPTRKIEPATHHDARAAPGPAVTACDAGRPRARSTAALPAGSRAAIARSRSSSSRAGRARGVGAAVATTLRRAAAAARRWRRCPCRA